MAVYYLLVVLAAFLQTVSRGIWWSALVVVWAAGKREAGEVYFLAFVGGMATDLLTGRPLGTTSLMLLSLAIAVLLFRSRFQFRARWLIVFLVLSAVFYYRFIF